MSRRADTDIEQVIGRLTHMHELHAAEQAAELARLREGVSDDSSLQGTVNKVVVILRDWLSDLDRDTLPAVRRGEESLRKEYDKALRDMEVPANPAVAAMLRKQLGSIERELARLPKD
jgi:uncharacterized protein (TIGR02284 family)